MTDYIELKRLAMAAKDALVASIGDECNHTLAEASTAADDRFQDAAGPEVVLALISEIQRLDENPGMRAIRSLRADCKDLMAERDQLKADIERITESHQKVCTNYNQVSYASEDRGRQIDLLKAENEALRKDAERYRGVRRAANRQGFTDEQFDQQTDTRIASFDAVSAKEASHG